jgi:hypothetical protein
MAADGATVVELLGDRGNVVAYTVADGFNISKGDILQILDPRTASFASTANLPVAGIAAADKEANDGSTQIPVWTYGIFDLKSSGSAITAGSLVIASGNNLIAVAGDLTTPNSGQVIGKALETCTSTAETIEVLVRV